MLIETKNVFGSQLKEDKTSIIQSIIFVLISLSILCLLRKDYQYKVFSINSFFNKDFRFDYLIFSVSLFTNLSFSS